jgi:hypothetical protein
MKMPDGSYLLQKQTHWSVSVTIAVRIGVLNYVLV